jgi:hypothetical protein
MGNLDAATIKEELIIDRYLNRMPNRRGIHMWLPYYLKNLWTWVFTNK